MRTDEIFYTGRDNTIIRSVSVDGVVIAHNELTRCQLLIGSTLVDSQVTPQAFDMTNPDRIIFKLGSVGLSAKSYFCWLVIFDADNTNGLVVDNFNITVRQV